MNTSDYISLDNDKLIITPNGERSTQAVKEDEQAALLKNHFSIIL